MRRILAILVSAWLLAVPSAARAAEGAGAAAAGEGSRGGVRGFPLGALQERFGKLPFPSLEAASLDNVPLRVEADRLSYDDDTGVAEAEGDVVVTFGERTFRARRIRYDGRSREALLEGDVRFGGPEGSFSFQRVRISLPEGTGALDNGTIDLGPGNYRISSEHFAKTGEKDYRVRNGTFTTCPCDPVPDWSFGASRLDVTVDGYAVGKDVVFRVRDVPVLWLPWGVFPAKVSRQSGLLLPEAGQSGRKGAFFSQPAYWAINRWSDATLTVEAMSRRGIRPELEYRLVPNRESEGTARGSWFRDTERKEELWRFWGENFLRVSDRWSMNARWDTASSGDYYRDFTEEELVRKARHVPSRGALEDRGGGDLLSVSFDLARESQIPGQPGATAKRLPEGTERFLPHVLPGGFDLRADGTVAYLDRGSEDATGSDAEGRARAFVELSRPSSVGPWLSVTPFVFLDGLASRPAGADNGVSWPWRAVPGAGARISTVLFGERARPAGHTYIHTVRPTLSYRWTPTVQQDDIPLTDEWSRLSNRSRFTFNLAQSFHRVEKEKVDPREILSLEVEWAWDAGNRKVDPSPYIDPLAPFSVALRDEADRVAGRNRQERSASDVLVQGRFLPYPAHRLAGELLVDPVDGTLTTASGAYEYGKKGGNRAWLGYRVTRDVSEEVKGLLSWRVLPFLRLRTEADYSLRGKSLTEGSVQALYLPKSECWTVGVVAKHTTIPEDTSAKVVFSLLGVGGTAEED